MHADQLTCLWTYSYNNFMRCEVKTNDQKPNMNVKNKPQKENTKAKNAAVFFQTSCQGQRVLLKGEPLPHFMPSWVKTDMSMC